MKAQRWVVHHTMLTEFPERDEWDEVYVGKPHYFDTYRSAYAYARRYLKSAEVVCRVEIGREVEAEEWWIDFEEVQDYAYERITIGFGFEGKIEIINPGYLVKPSEVKS